MAKKMMNLIIGSDDNYEAALNIRDAVEEFNCNGKVLDIFTNQILSLVKNKFHEHANIDNKDNKWITVKFNGFNFSVYYDMKQFQVQKTKSVSLEKKEAIIGKMSEKTKYANSAKNEWDIWDSKDIRYRDDLKGYDGDMYIYKLYKIYSESPQSVADYIVSIAKKLEKI